MNVTWGSEVVRETYFTLYKDRVWATRIVESSAVASKPSALARLRHTAHEEVCVCVCVCVLICCYNQQAGKMVKFTQVITAYVKSKKCEYKNR